MKKFLLIISAIFMLQSVVFADEIIDSKGNITECKIITICNGLIQYQKNGFNHSINRVQNQAVFNDFVDVIDNLKHKDITTRYTGTVLFKDFQEVQMQVQNGQTMVIPWYKVKFIGLYDPN